MDRRRTLNAEDAELLGRPVGTVFLKALRTTYDRKNRFMEQVESLLDPGALSPAPAVWRVKMTALNRALGAFYGLALATHSACRPNR